MEKGRILMKKGYTRSVPETLTQVKKVGFCWVWGEVQVGRWMLDVTAKSNSREG